MLPQPTPPQAFRKEGYIPLCLLSGLSCNTRLQQALLPESANRGRPGLCRVTSPERNLASQSLGQYPQAERQRKHG